MKIFSVKRLMVASCLIGLLSSCADNIREQSADEIAGRIARAAKSDSQGFLWRAPDLYSSQYRTLFFGYDTLKYHLLTPENQSNGFRLLVQANYGGAMRHYELAKFADQSTRALAPQQHFAERCQLFNSLISSCLYQDQFALALSASDLQRARLTGLNVVLQSHSQQYEAIDLPAAYIEGFLKAVGQPSQHP